jgi:copper(I)-binding protein
VNRALRAATMGVLLLSPIALTACSAGQVAQTATQERDKTGAQAQVGDLTLRAVVLENPRSGSYEDGDDAELRMAIVNGGQETDTLVGIEGEGFGDAEIRTSGASGASTGGGSGDEIEIPSDTTVFVGEDDTTVTLTDLEESLTTGQYLDLTLTFENAGEVDMQVTVANPEEAEERGEAFDFHHEEGETSGETARENESADSE